MPLPTMPIDSLIEQGNSEIIDDFVMKPLQQQQQAKDDSINPVMIICGDKMTVETVDYLTQVAFLTLK